MCSARSAGALIMNDTQYIRIDVEVGRARGSFMHVLAAAYCSSFRSPADRN